MKPCHVLLKVLAYLTTNSNWFYSELCLSDSEWSELGSHSAVFSMQGRRPGNEDRAVIKRVEMVEGVDDDEEAVHIWAVMDGHGGEASRVASYW